ncbi:MAG: flagellar M-ring protein FliF [Rhodospirillaceae bacterium]|nr:flagellar M-ring protein FliF [Rhodospirillaceae bacterium]|tara:strand:+ start:3392 stop:5146 length:1755 start_codon:yes stop_codon:yes gene_type:complete
MVIDMATSTSDVVINEPGGPLAGVMQRVKNFSAFVRQPSVQRALPTLAALVLLPFGLVIYFSIQTPERTSLYGSLPEAEKAKVIEALRNQGVDVAVDPVTGEVTVPLDDYHSSRMSLAAQGLPETVADGYGGLKDLPMGASRSLESIKLKQTQEVELAKSISNIDIIKSARVHLAIPERSVFARNSLPPKASVFVNLARGRTLTSDQISAIVNLVSSSVPNLARENVAVIDQIGRLLSNNELDQASRLTDKQFGHKIKVENVYRSRVEALLSPLVGSGNVNVQVSVSLDFTKKTKSLETYDPNGRVIRSEKVMDEKTARKKAMGIPGAVTNTPPAEGEQNNPDKAAVVENQSGKSTKDQDVTTRKNIVRNYDLSRTLFKEETPLAQIRKINVAILMKEEKEITPAEGAQPKKDRVSEIAVLEKLVTSALGLDAARGDTLVILERPFVDMIPEAIKINWYEEKWVKDLAINFMTFLVMCVLAIGVVKPLVNRIVFSSKADQSLQQAQAELVQADEELQSLEVQPGESLDDIKKKLKPTRSGISSEMLDTANTYDDKVAIIRMIVSDEAGRVSNVFKGMIQEDLNA